MFDQPYYYNYDLTYRLLKKNAEEIVPSFSLIDFYNKEILHNQAGSVLVEFH